MLLCRWNWHGIVLSRIFISQNNQKTERLKRWHDTMLIINKVLSVSPSQRSCLSSLWKQEWLGVTAYLFTSWRSVSWPTPLCCFHGAWGEHGRRLNVSGAWKTDSQRTPPPACLAGRSCSPPGRAGICVASSSRGAKPHWDSGSDLISRGCSVI